MGLIFGFARNLFFRISVVPGSAIFTYRALPASLEVTGMCFFKLGKILIVRAEGTIPGGDVEASGTVVQIDVGAFGSVEQKELGGCRHRSEMLVLSRERVFFCCEL